MPYSQVKSQVTPYSAWAGKINLVKQTDVEPFLATKERLTWAGQTNLVKLNMDYSTTKVL